MPTLTPDRELQLQVTKWVLSPGNNRDALGFAALAVLEAEIPSRDFPGRHALPELAELAHQALEASAAGRALDRDRTLALKVASALALAECNAWRAGAAVDQAEAEAKRFGAPAPVDRWKERADL